MASMGMTDPAVQAAAASALDLIRDGMRVGFGTGHGALAFLAGLADRVRSGLRVVGVPTSEEETPSHRPSAESMESGLLGVIGPTRMQYGRAIAVVRYMSQVMNELIAEVYGYGNE